MITLEILFSGLFLMTVIAGAQSPLRIACVGDSITYGDKLSDRDTQSYPAVLERLSAGRYLVGNFGVNGATAVEGIPFRAWSATQACRDALAFAPDIVVLMLGINDLFYPEWHARYPADLRALVTRFQTLPSAPRIFLCTLTPIAPAERQAPANQAIRDTMNPAIRAVAAETGVGIIDISAVYPNRLELLPDGLHPSPEGAALIARTVLAALAPDPASQAQIQPAPTAGPVDISIRNEARAARARAEEWLRRQPDSPQPAPAESKAVSDIHALLPLLTGHSPPGETPLYPAYARLAAALAAQGHETVFPPDHAPIAWREALLHQLVQRQRIDPQGGGYWAEQNEDDPAAAARATTHALQAIARALEE